MSEQDIRGIYNFRPVDEYLVTSGQPTEEQLNSVAGSGFEVVINLALHDDPRYSLPDEAGTVASLGMDYVHIPVRFDAPAESDLKAFFKAMKQHEGKKILVHCAANMRVSAFVGLYRVIEQDWPESDAFALMDSLWEPNPVWRVFIANMLEKSRKT
jgi:uncharacterized protein (TIGR01244 family)